MKKIFTIQYDIQIGVKSLLLFLLAGWMYSCTERIDIKTDAGEERLVIYGYLTSDTTQHSIRVTRSAGYFATTAPEGVSDATVTITSGDSVMTLIESTETPGLYQTAANTYGQEGKTYVMRVEVDFDGDGQKELFEASSYMPHSAPIDSITLQPSPTFDDVIEVWLYGAIPNNEINNFSFHTYRNDRLLNDSLSGFFIISGDHISGNRFNGLSCYYLDQEDEETRLAPGDVVTLRLDILTKEYTDFLDNAKRELGGSNPIFSGPPANVETNIRSLKNPNQIAVSGFFSAYSGQKASRVYK